MGLMTNQLLGKIPFNYYVRVLWGFFEPPTHLHKVYFFPSTSSDVIDKIGVPLDIDETLLSVIKTLSFKRYVFDPLNHLFGSGNVTYSEDITTKSTVDEVLFKVSTPTPWLTQISFTQMSLRYGFCKKSLLYE
jgi:hypothetical protein